MRIKSVLSDTIVSVDIRDIDSVKKYMETLEYPKNIFSQEYRRARELELELIKHVQILELLNKYQEDINWLQIELHYYRDAPDTECIIEVEFRKYKKQKEFAKDYEAIRSISKKKLKKLRKRNKA